MKIAFVCVENSCRSQIAEALAKKMFPQAGMEFVSAGTNPAESVDTGAIQFLKQDEINWNGKPKFFSEIGNPDILVTMGCDVECPYIPGARIIEWDILDPKGKKIAEYRQVAQKIKDKLLQLVDKLNLLNSN